ncbi:MAG: hypothetical protein U5K38_17160 [Woeseiaceae bacterium]|nr:hypothetical protein [Woeseiaceae bacterium]
MSESAQPTSVPSLEDKADAPEAFVTGVIEALEAAEVPAPVRKIIENAGEQLVELINAQNAIRSKISK